jgi:Uma2 family endonuclease
MSRLSARISPAQQKKLLLDLLPDQGAWTEEDYLWLTDHTQRLVEFTDGFLEVLPTPTDRHQSVLEFMFLMFHAFVTARGGKVHVAALRVHLRPGQFREPDLLLLLDAKDPRRQDRFWLGADLVLEVVSKDNPERDLIQKRHEYARAKIREYWIVNPLTETILVYQSTGTRYRKAGEYARGTQAVSVLLRGFAVNVADVFDAD